MPADSYEIDTLLEIITVLASALERFANIRADDGDTFAAYPREVIIRCEVSVGEIHDARAAMKKLQDWHDAKVDPNGPDFKYVDLSGEETDD